MGILNLFRRAARPTHEAAAATGEGLAAINGRLHARLNATAVAIGPEHLRPFLRSRSALAKQQLLEQIMGTTTATIAPLSAIGGDLVVDLFADQMGCDVVIEPQQLRDLNLDPARALELATANLLERSTTEFTTLGPGVFVAGSTDSCASSRLLVPDRIAALPVKGDPVAMVPVRSMLLVTGADDKNGLLTMAGAAAEALALSPDPLSAQPLRLADGAWSDFTPDAIEYASLHDLMRGQHLREYAEQKELLDQLHAQEDDDIFVANYAPMQDRRTGRAFGMTFWADGMSSLLPRADVIAFKPADEVILVPWDAAMPIVGHRMTRTDHYPVRFRVDTFPSVDSLDRLRAVATLAKPVKTGS
jgi:hypothetical protein